MSSKTRVNAHQADILRILVHEHHMTLSEIVKKMRFLVGPMHVRYEIFKLQRLGLTEALEEHDITFKGGFPPRLYKIL